MTSDKDNIFEIFHQKWKQETFPSYTNFATDFIFSTNLYRHQYDIKCIPQNIESKLKQQFKCLIMKDRFFLRWMPNLLISPKPWDTNLVVSLFVWFFLSHSSRTRDTHNYGWVLSSGAVITCFYDLSLSRMGFEHQTFRYEANALAQCATAVVGVRP